VAQPSKLQHLIPPLLPLERSKLWMSPLEMAHIEPTLRRRSLHPTLERMARNGLVVRRKNAITGRWEYARPAKAKRG
jgi:hypothetical protein